MKKDFFLVVPQFPFHFVCYVLLAPEEEDVHWLCCFPAAYILPRIIMPVLLYKASSELSAKRKTILF